MNQYLEKKTLKKIKLQNSFYEACIRAQMNVKNHLQKN
jgi:hypothetical protein